MTAAIVVVLIAYPVRRLTAWLTSHFVVTSDRVIHREGLIAKRSMEIPLEEINDVRFEQGVFDRLVGAGTLVMQSASEAGREEFAHIRKPEDVQRTIYHQGELNQTRMRGGSGVSAPSPTTELERLADLRAKGVLTEAEFQAQKAKSPRVGLTRRDGYHRPHDRRRPRPRLLLDPRHGRGRRVLP